MARLLLVDDEQKILGVLSRILSIKNYEVDTAADGPQALKLLASKHYDLILCDLQMSPVSGMTLLRQVSEAYPALPFIMCTAYSSVDTALESLKIGAFDYVTKPFNLQELLAVFERALAWTPNEDRTPKRPANITYGPEHIVCESSVMRELCSRLGHLAPADASVLFRGETGVGKKLAGQALHGLSPRRTKDFRIVSCTNLDSKELENELFGYVAGAFLGATADLDGALIKTAGGTLFLDEITAMPLPLQERILHLIKNRTFRPGGVAQDLPIDVRILAGTSQNIEPLIRAGKFSPALFARLAPMAQEIPPLRRRREDVLPLAAHFLGEAGAPADLWMTSDVQGAFMHYDWPGNVAEIATTMRHALAQTDNNALTRASLPPQIMLTLSGKNLPDWAIPSSGSPRGQAARKYLENEQGSLASSVPPKQESKGKTA